MRCIVSVIPIFHPSFGLIFIYQGIFKGMPEYQRLAGGGRQLCGRAGKPRRAGDDPAVRRVGRSGAGGGPAHQLAALLAAEPPAAGPGLGHGALRDRRRPFHLLPGEGDAGGAGALQLLRP